MKNLSKWFIFCLVAMFVFVSCGKKPEKELLDAQTAIESMKVEAEKYVPADLAQVNQEMETALGEIKTQEGKIFKNFDKAKEMLTKVKQAADNLGVAVNEKKEEAKNSANTALTEIKTVIESLKTQLPNLPSGKAETPEVTTLKTDIGALDAQVQEIQPLIDGQDFLGAGEKATALKTKVAALNEQITAVIAKKEELKKGGKKKPVTK